MLDLALSILCSQGIDVRCYFTTILLSSWYRKEGVDKNWREMCSSCRLRTCNWRIHEQRLVNGCRVSWMSSTRSSMLPQWRLALRNPSLTADQTRASPLLGQWVETADRASGATAHVPQCRQLHHPVSWITKAFPPIQMLAICIPFHQCNYPVLEPQF